MIGFKCRLIETCFNPIFRNKILLLFYYIFGDPPHVYGLGGRILSNK